MMAPPGALALVILVVVPVAVLGGIQGVDFYPTAGATYQARSTHNKTHPGGVSDALPSLHRPAGSHAADDACPLGQHAPPLRTYFLSASSFTLTPAEAMGEGGPWLDLEIPVAAASGMLPFVENRKGAMQHGVLSTARFLRDWAALSAAARPQEGAFACPSAAVAMQCGSKGGCGAGVSTGGGVPLRTSAPNALLVSGADFKRGAVLDIYHLESRGDAAVMRVRWQRDPDFVPEGGVCHAEQDMEPGHAHYHQLPGCGVELIEDLQELLSSDGGMTMFVKGSSCPGAIGQYQVPRGPPSSNSTCIPCPAGTAVSGGGNSYCDPCAAGTFAGTTGTIAPCPNCPAGTYSGAGATACITCPAGTSAAAGSSRCTPCAAGTYAAAGAGSCTPCAGAAVSPPGAAACVQDCPAGTYLPAGSACALCSAGTYTPGVGYGSCTACTGSTYSPEGATACVGVCPPGTYVSANACIKCAAGTYSSTAGAVACTDCGAGEFSAAGSASCTSCAAGTWQDCPTGSACTPCAFGQANPSSGSTTNTCAACAAGSYAPFAGSSQCTLCGPGTFLTTTGGITGCGVCDLGTYSTATGATSTSTCINCPAGTYTEGLGSSSCTLCPAGTYRSSPAGTAVGDCSPCPAGMLSSADRTQCVCADGYGGNCPTRRRNLLSCRRRNLLTPGGTCTLCAPGTYGSGLTPSQPCQPCVGNSFSGAGAAACSSCGVCYTNDAHTACGRCDFPPSPPPSPPPPPPSSPPPPSPFPPSPPPPSPAPPPPSPPPPGSLIVVPVANGSMGYAGFTSQTFTAADKIKQCQALKDATDWPSDLLDCAVGQVKDINVNATARTGQRAAAASPGVAVFWTMVYNIRAPSQSAAANAQVTALVTNLLNATFTQEAFKPFFPINTPVTLEAAYGEIPKPFRPCGLISGRYQLVNANDSSCPQKASKAYTQYLVYFGGSPNLCATNVTLMRAKGQFKPQRSLWTLKANAKTNVTKLLTAGRQCAAGDNGLAGHTSHPRDNDVVLAGKSHWWRVVRLSEVDCSLVNLVDQSRAAMGVPAYLSAPKGCATTEERRPVLAPKDDGSGRQRWKLIAA